MKKKTNALVPAAAILVLLCAAYGLITWQQKKSGESSQRREEEQIYMTDIEGISSLSWEKDGQGLSFEKEGDTWYYQTDRDCPIRQYTLSTLADTLSKLGAWTLRTAWLPTGLIHRLSGLRPGQKTALPGPSWWAARLPAPGIRPPVTQARPRNTTPAWKAAIRYIPLGTI